MKKFLLIFVFGIMLIPTGCKKKTPDTPDPEPPISHEPVVTDNAKIMDAATRNAISSIDTTNFTFTFNAETDLLKNLKVGDVLVDSCSDKAAYGYLRKVTAIEGSRGNKTVTTEQAKLFDVLQQGSIDFNSGKLTRNRISRMELAKGVTFRQNKNTDFTVFDFDYDMDLGDGANTITFKGNTSLSMDVFFYFDWHVTFNPNPWIEVDKFETGIELNQSASLNLNSQAGATLSTGVVKLASFYFQPWVFSVGPIPVVFVPKVDLILHANGTVSAEFSTGASEEFDGKLGVRYKPSTTQPPLPPNDGWEPIAEAPYSYDYYPPSLQISTNAEAHVGPEASLLIYGVIGPFTNVTGCLQLDASLHSGTNNWDMDFNVGANAEVGVEIDILNFEQRYSIEKCLFTQNLMHLDNEPMGTDIFFEHPDDGHWYSLGSTITLKARTTGDTPSQVDFLLDGSLLTSDTQEPYQYDWNTSTSTYGEHTLVVNDIKDSQIIASDTVTISLLNATWETIDLSSLGQSNETVNHDVFFADENNGWIAGGSRYGLWGYLLKTTDGGQTWQNTAPQDFTYAIHKIVHDGNDIIVNTAGNYVYMAGDWSKDYGFYDDEGNWIITFNDGEVYDIALSPNGYLETIFKDYISETFSIENADAVTHKRVASCPIPYNESTPSIYFQNLKGIVYNIVTNNNPLRQYIMVSNDGGNSWETKTLNASGITTEDRIYGAYFITDEHGWLVGHESQGFATVLITNDGGDSWEKVNVENAYSFSSVQFITNIEGYATDNSTDLLNGDPAYKLFHTMDGGYTWEPVEVAYTQMPMLKVNFIGPYRGYAVGNGSETYRFTVEK